MKLKGIKSKLFLLPLLFFGENNPIQIFNPRQFEPPEEFISWYYELEECTNIRRDIGSLEWFWVDDIYYKNVPKIVGLSWGNQIFLKENTEHSRKYQVKHELLHYLTRDYTPGKDFPRLSLRLRHCLPSWYSAEDQ